MPKPIATDSQKINLIPELVDGMSQLHQIIVTGNIEKGVPSLLEDIRGIKRDVSMLTEKQVTNEELERRVKDIEDRHERIDEQKKKRDPYMLAGFSIALSNIVVIILLALGWGK